MSKNQKKAASSTGTASSSVTGLPKGAYAKDANNNVIKNNQNKEAGISKTEFQQSVNVDLRSSAVKKGELFFTPKGTVDKRSSAVKNGDVILTKDGNVDKRSSAFKQGQISFKK